MDINIEPDGAPMVSLLGTYILLVKYPISAKDLHMGLGKYSSIQHLHFQVYDIVRGNLKDWINFLGFNR